MENNIDEDIKEKIILLKDFIEGNFERDKIEHYKGSYKMGFFYYSDIKDAISNVLSELKKQTNISRSEYDKHMEKKRQNEVLENNNRILKQELEKQVNNTHILQSQLDVANAEKIEYKKIAEKLASLIHKINDKEGCYIGKYGLVENCKGMTWCNDCIIDWARKEVEKDDNR